MKIIWIALAGVALLAGSAAGATKGGSVALVAYSTPKDAYGKIISAFQKTSAGNGTSFSQSYGASGDQARAVAAGQPADDVPRSPRLDAEPRDERARVSIRAPIAADDPPAAGELQVVGDGQPGRKAGTDFTVPAGRIRLFCVDEPRDSTV